MICQECDNDPCLCELYDYLALDPNDPEYFNDPDDIYDRRGDR